LANYFTEMFIYCTGIDRTGDSQRPHAERKARNVLGLEATGRQAAELIGQGKYVAFTLTARPSPQPGSWPAAFADRT
jgi:hypothetical protein